MTIATAESPRSPILDKIVDFLRSPLAVLGLLLALALGLSALFAPWIAPQDPYDLMAIDVMDARMPPGTKAFGSDLTYLLGTDGQGRDLLSAILYGLRTSITVGLGSAILAGIIGTVLGLIAAYAGGRTDSIIMRLVDLIMALPSILVALMVLSVFGPGVLNVVLTLVLMEWAYYARTARSQALVESQRDYVEAARGLGISSVRVLLRHILPNCLPPLLVIGTLQIARAITLEATLSFLGLGVPITQPSLGLLVSNGYQYMLSGNYWITFFPGLALLLAIVSINLIADRMREVLDPRALR
ncbi:ABC transporter permease [Nitratireductor aquimarinus]|uniref:ABC transporter permease n=1 Tax=Nitratireductor TaxID=245876 RepID=UPI0019D3FDA3|nr:MULTISPECIES: ABC transporter permease [Nitratireductor]MBN7776603.1 ABC transporter permease [Nitratireductor pacificus]MBN7779470.1 ABC transporter permease [Nitratireductor pacificus]MBN7788277.1 ABC transporter permease [Nitratireductor aquimarinus]MBY6098324.1 ABC transporter permease [Nitratireductor aquimarinus]MCA1261008.1 ABC transporter permease [Nitratireductor aquimarinus]